MRTPNIEKKRDFKFIIISVLIIALIFACSLFIKGGSNLDYGDLPDSIDVSIGKLVINEVMANNGGAFVNSNNECTDYIEIYNGSGKEIDLNNYGLSDKAGTVKWVFTNYTIKPNEYLVVGLAGKNESGLNANFKLSSNGGEKVILTNPSGKVVDAVEVEAIAKNEVMVRDENGSWYVTTSATPGYENSKSGRLAYLESIKEIDNTGLVINEIMPKNNGSFINEYGLMDGFIEVMNNSKSMITLSEYYLSDSDGEPFNYQLPKKSLMPGDCYVLYLGKGSYGADGYTGFNLSSGSGVVTLSKNGKIVQIINYTELDSGKAYTLDKNGTYYETSVVSPGYENTVDGITEFQKKYNKMPVGLVINEVMNENFEYLPQNGAEYYDWVELYNNSKETINLKDYYLSNDKNDLKLYNLPDLTISAGGYVVIMCSGNTNLSNNSYKHANFKIGSSDGVYLSNADSLVDSLFIGDVPIGYSYGRTGEYGFGYMKPTPKAQNNDGARFRNAIPEFSQMGGLYETGDTITLSLSGSGTIRYTTDGSTPNSSSKIYTEPITISKTTVVKAKGYSSNALTSGLGYNTYFFGEGANLDVLSLTMDPSEFSALNSSGGSTKERQAYVEFYEEGNYFKTPCSITLFGGNARWQVEKSYALRFDSDFGASNLEYQVFSNRDNSVYDALVLRCGSTAQNSDIIRDVVTTSLADDYTDLAVQSYRTVNVFVNGKYWGIYNIREKVTKQFFKEHYNTECDDLDLIRLDGEIKYGSKTRYNEIKKFITSANLNNDANWEKACEMINMQNFIDYWIGEAWTTNNDILNCRFFISSNIDNGRLNYVFYDFDYGWVLSRVDGQNEYLHGIYDDYLVREQGIGYGYNYDNEILKALFKCEKFREMWLERLSYNLKNTWNPQTVLDRIDYFYNLYAPDIKRTQEKWGRTVEQWIEGLEDRREYATYRNYYFMQETKKYFNLSDDKMVELFGSDWNVKPTYTRRYRASDII